MRIIERAVGEVTILDATGRMTVTEGHGLVRQRVNSQLASGQRQFVLNLSEVSYMDSACVGELVGAYLTTRNQGGTLKFAGVTGPIAQLFTVAKLDTVFELFDTDDAALESFSSSGSP